MLNSPCVHKKDICNSLGVWKPRSLFIFQDYRCAEHTDKKKEQGFAIDSAEGETFEDICQKLLLLELSQMAGYCPG